VRDWLRANSIKPNPAAMPMAMVAMKTRSAAWKSHRISLW